MIWLNMNRFKTQKRASLFTETSFLYLLHSSRGNLAHNELGNLNIFSFIHIPNLLEKSADFGSYSVGHQGNHGVSVDENIVSPTIYSGCKEVDTVDFKFDTSESCGEVRVICRASGCRFLRLDVDNVHDVFLQILSCF